MVDKRYLLERPAPPGRGKLYLDQTIIPALIDLAGACEVGLEHVAQRAKRAPMAGLVFALASGWLLAALIRASRR